MRRRLRLALFATLPALLGACAQSNAPPPKPTPAAHPEDAAAPLPARARWVRSGGATRIGPSLPQGTMVLLGGRRALVHPDGSVTPERVPTPEPLYDIVLVPAPGGDRLIGHGKHTVYRFDDPLGAPTALVGTLDRVEIDHIGAGPGVLVVWGVFWARYNDPAPPMVVDVVTGEASKLVGWPEVRLRDIAFRTMNEGAALFEGLGLGITRDGGKTFGSPVTDKPEQGRLFERLSRRGDAFSARRDDVHAPSFHAAIDLASGRVAAFSRETSGLSPTLAWIARTATDPLAAAVAEGSLDRNGKLVIGVDGVAARVDPETGAVVEIAVFDEAKADPRRAPREKYGYVDPRAPHPRSRCLVAHLPQEGLLLCPVLGARRFSLEGPLDPRPFETFDPENHQYKNRDLVYRPGGGFAFLGYCSQREGGDQRPAKRLCTLQKRARFESVKPPEGIPIYHEHGLGALSDGRVVLLARDPRSDFDTEGDPRPFFLVSDARGAIQKLPPLSFPDASRPATVLGSIEEGADGALHALLSTSHGLLSVRQPWDGPATITPLPAALGELRRGRGVALGEEMLISSDAGASFTAVGPWPSLPEGGTRDELVVGEGGVEVGDWLRVGWGPGEPFAPPPPVASPPIVLPSKPATEWPTRRLVCKTLGRLGPAPPLWDEAELTKLFDRARGPAPARRTLYHSIPGWTTDGFVTRLSSFAEDAEARSPTHWALQFIDPREKSGKVHTWTFTPPAGVPTGAWLEGVFRAGKRTVLSVSHRAPRSLDGEPESTTWHLALVPPQGEARWVSFTQPDDGTSRGASLGVTLGEGEADPILLRNRSGIFVWEAGAAPRSLHPPSPVLLGAPRGKTIPLLLRGQDWSAAREVSIGGASEPSLVLPFEGWQSVPLSGKDALATLKPCGPNPSGMLFREMWMHGTLVVVVDGTPTVALQARSEIRIDGSAACLVGVDAHTSTMEGSKSTFGFVKADFATKSGHGIEAGRGAQVRQLECALE
ncbi:hypothetical protein [Polyangium aurulentum]|uniref:hypothetical protein n=1 Tax=Polyangium aurulentum TaxID=2567896 RepID=UPI0010AE3564|nr:hypothetical protein [Polyangium aurulentum]UQA59985.1 hypothetical protein E8A73_005695 [Polyangium aurulentum]